MLIRINEAADSGVIVSTLEVIEASLNIVVVASIAERVTICEVGGVGQDCAGCIPDSFHLAPLVILVGCDQPWRFHGNEVHCYHVALQVLGEQVILPIAVGEIRIVGTETNDVPGFVEGIAHGEVFAAVCVVPPFRYRRTIYYKIIHRRAVGVHLPGAQTICVIRIPGGFRAGFGRCATVTIIPLLLVYISFSFFICSNRLTVNHIPNTQIIFINNIDRINLGKYSLLALYNTSLLPNASVRIRYE